MIQIKDLSFSYTKKHPYILNNINLNINKGDYISFLGENGSGKSTLVKLILKILEPTEGRIQRDAIKIGYVPQRFDNLNTQFPITVYELLDSYRKTLKVKDKQCINDYLEFVKMGEFKRSLIGNLSGGQCQKIFIARALIGSPDLLILDEPSNGVDIQSQEEIYNLIRKVNRTESMTVISVEHNLKAAISNSSHIYHLSGGKGHLCRPEEYIREFVKTNTGDDSDVTL
ncbi:MAG: metal ABC transporter ATP-binding protein [Bacillota bacterium]|nr:metal ABC transporter ATP-binding protein [Bacillota bacterium]